MTTTQSARELGADDVAAIDELRQDYQQMCGELGKDVVAVAEPVLMHRVVTSFGAESEGISSRQIVRRLIDELEQEG